MEAIIRVCGAAGTGVASVGQVISKIATRSDLYLQTYNFYQSVIRGGHTAFHMRISNEEIHSLGDGVDYILALDEDAAEIQMPHLNVGGHLIYDVDTVQVDATKLPRGAELMPVPLVSLARKEGRETRMLNTSGVGAITALLSLEKDILQGILQELFTAKSKRLAESNVNAALAGYTYIEKNYGSRRRRLVGRKSRLLSRKRSDEKKRLIMSGNEAIALGAIAAGCRFYAAYPMTPATSILHTMVAKAEKYGIVAKQAEDEISVINMTIGAAFAGARAACGTSGGGFALMTEALGEAGITETPIVVIESARGGPSTGLPTRTEQGDLNQLLGASQGDYPRIIFAPGTVAECFYAAGEAFNLADRFQCPVIISMDLALSEAMASFDSLDAQVPINRPIRAKFEEGKPFKRYLLTDTGISPTSFPGDPGLAYVAGSDEHDEDATLLSDVLSGLPSMLEARRNQMEKRMRKLETALNELPPPQLEGPADAPITLVGWGSTKGIIRDARATLESQGVVTNHLQIRYLMPFHSKEVRAILENRKFLVIEANYSGQLERLIKAETGLESNLQSLRKYDGDPIYPKEIVQAVKEVQ
ncbi:MAG: 2-oxoacid:acceptor oxidoreductase subunit alpha [Candidatus Hodarchaeales archaeon]